MAETKGFYLRNTSVSELPDGATIDIVGYRPDNTVFDTFTVQVIAGIADIERTAQQVLGWPDEIRVEIVATTTQGLESRASTPALVRRGTGDLQFMVVSTSFVIVNQTTLAATVELTENAPMTLQVRALGETVWENRVVQSSYNFGNGDSPHYQETELTDGTWEVRAIDGVAGAYETLIYTVSVDAPDVNETLVVSKSAVLIDRNTVAFSVELSENQPMAVQYREPGGAWINLPPTQDTQNFGGPGSPHYQERDLPDGTWQVRALDHIAQTWVTTFQDITVTPSNETTYGPQETYIYQLSVSSDNAEEVVSSGSVQVGGADLELVTDNGVPQIVGLRFSGVPIPSGSQIDSADIQFGADERSYEDTVLTLRAQAADNASSFTTATNNISSRPTTGASVTWDVPDWDVLDRRSAAEQTPDLSPIIQEVVNRSGWSAGNALAVVVSGTGRRVAEPSTADGNVPANAPEMTIQYRPLVTGGGGGGSGGGSGASAGGGWDFESYASAPEGRQWNIVHASAQGTIDGGHPRITRDQTVDGKTCYRHQVDQGEEVQMVDDDGTPINITLSSVDRVLFRFHHRRNAYGGRPGKDCTLMLGYGYQGDMVRNSDGKYNRPISEAAAFGSTEGACANAMHPEKNGGAENGLRMLATHAVKVPNFNKADGADNSQYNDAYYGDNLGGSGPTPALNQWHTIDIIAHRTEGYTMYLDGVFVANSSNGGPSNRAPFDNWNAQKCIWWWHRHMHGGDPEDELSRRDYSEWFGGFYLATN